MIASPCPILLWSRLVIIGGAVIVRTACAAPPAAAFAAQTAIAQTQPDQSVRQTQDGGGGTIPVPGCPNLLWCEHTFFCPERWHDASGEWYDCANYWYCDSCFFGITMDHRLVSRVPIGAQLGWWLLIEQATGQASIPANECCIHAMCGQAGVFDPAGVFHPLAGWPKTPDVHLVTPDVPFEIEAGSYTASLADAVWTPGGIPILIMSMCVGSNEGFPGPEWPPFPSQFPHRSTGGYSWVMFARQHYVVLHESCTLADINADQTVNSDDLGLVLAAWGTTDWYADITQDGVVNVDDLLTVINHWGACAERGGAGG